MALCTMTRHKLLIFSHSLKRKKCKPKRILNPFKEDMMNILLTSISISKSLVGILFVINEISGTNLKALISIKIILIPASSLSLIIKPDKLEPTRIKLIDWKINLPWHLISHGPIFKNVTLKKWTHSYKFQFKLKKINFLKGLCSLTNKNYSKIFK